MSAIKMERCPPSAWNGVRHHGGMLSAITAERRPGSRGIRRLKAVAAPLDVRLARAALATRTVGLSIEELAVLATDDEA